MAAERSRSVIPKACFNCRIRKIRCDKQYPCSSCSTSGIDCKPSAQGPGLQRTQPRQPTTTNGALDLSQLAENIEQIQNSVQQLLALSNRQSVDSSNASNGSSKGTSPRPSIETSATIDSLPAVYEGVSSFAAQALGAGEVSQSLAQDHAQLVAAQEGLRHLREVVSRGSPPDSAGTPGKSATVHLTIDHARDIQLPPIDHVLTLLKTFKSHPSTVLLAYGLGQIDEVETLCRAAYFPTQPMSVGALTMMHGLLLFLMMEWMLHPDLNIPRGVEPQALYEQCERNFDAGLQFHEIWTNPTLENVKALRIAACRAQENSNMKRSWTVMACAARHVLNMGLHRRGSYTNLSEHEVQDRLKTFWTIFGYERNLALTFGQTSTIRDDDIDVDMLTPSRDSRFTAWDESLISFVSLARLEGQISERLYTARALKQSPQERLAIVKELSQGFDHWFLYQRPQARADTIYPDIYDVLCGKTTVVIYYSLLATLHRNTFATIESAGVITQECYDAARQGLAAHLEIFPSVRDFREGRLVNAYLTWFLLYGSFTPLVVVFLHAISVFDLSDLDLLFRFQQSLDEVVEPRESTLRLRNACAIFSSVAQAYVGSRAQANEGYRSKNATVVRRENLHEAFENSQNTSHGLASEQGANWDGSADVNVDEMYTFVDNWIDGSQQAVDLFNVDFVI
ncbi:ABC-transporter-regulating transcription factor [Pseudocercospora fuligena]|uniref:ABC-transporter-regulating transcription factor n=1 Tax=Pseudocercospora fuligena TaxID=685502 RepID=A0A8H6RKW5_9PEZI|nr:ABC-transporter-regulating transcription factor [Pseudocercospora fuligena]